MQKATDFKKNKSILNEITQSTSVEKWPCPFQAVNAMDRKANRKRHLYINISQACAHTAKRYHDFRWTEQSRPRFNVFGDDERISITYMKTNRVFQPSVCLFAWQRKYLPGWRRVNRRMGKILESLLLSLTPILKCSGFYAL